MPRDKEAKDRTRLIKRYGNRKLYDVRKSRYITLEGIRELVRAGEDVRVLDKTSGEDLTKVTLAQIIYEDEKRNISLLSLPLLRWLVERGDEALRDFMRSMERGREALENVRDATEKSVQRIITAPQRQLDSLQHTIDAQVERVTSHPALQKELRRVEKGIRQLETRLAKLTGATAPSDEEQSDKPSRKSAAS